ncbi:glycosyltransferase family 2 protein [Pararcticibacter amylolyticus]|nr:glycosyltransferase family 2 protein [Pararcticibacter amylolyticus]
MDTITIIIPVYNRIEVTKQGLTYISRSVDYYNKQASSPEYNIQIVMVDDGSTDGTAELIKKAYPYIHVVESEGDLWWTGAVNLGINYSLQHFENLKAVILQNDDVMLEEDWLHVLIKTASKHPGCLIGCATSVPDSRDLINYGGRDINAWFAKEKRINYKVPRLNFQKGYVTDSFDLYGRGLYIPVEVFHKTGLFDQKRFKHRGDLDIPLRAKKEGYHLLVSYDAIVYELPQHSFSLDSQEHLTLKDIYRSLTDFRSSNNIGFIYHYSLIATRSPLQFIIFFISNFYYNFRGICWRYCKQWLIR